MMKQTQKDILFWWDTLGIDEKKRLSKKYYNEMHHQLSYMQKKFIWKHEPKQLSIYNVKKRVELLDFLVWLDDENNFKHYPNINKGIIDKYLKQNSINK